MTTVKEPFATQLREKLRRICTGDLSADDLAEIDRHKRITDKYKVIWKDIPYMPDSDNPQHR